MTILTWNKQLVLGIEAVDKQHKHLLELINQLDEAIALGQDKKSMTDVVNDLIDYTVYHFRHEENLMQKAGYNGQLYAEHQAEHMNFVEKIQHAHTEALKDPSIIREELLDFLVDWLSHHILNTDKHMADSLLQGVKGDNLKIDVEEQADIMQSNLYSALRESEGRFRELSDYLPALIWITNSKNIPIFCNHFWFKIFNIKQGVYNKTLWMEAIHPDDRNRVVEAYSKALSELTKIKIQYRLLRPDGSLFWILETASPRLRKNGSFAGLMGCGMDITSQKKAEKTLAQSNQFLEEEVNKRTQQLLDANQNLQQEKNRQISLNHQLKEAQGHLVQSEKMASIGLLAAGVAHEINNPLGYIYSNLNSLKHYIKDLVLIAESADRLAAQLPQDNSESEAFLSLKQSIDLDFIKEDLEDLVNESIEGATRAKKIVQDLRDFSRIDKQELEMFDLEAGMDATLNIVNNELKYKAEIIKEYGGLKPFECVGTQLNQVFLNLLVNAAQSIEEFGKITVRTGYKNNDWIWVEVEDTGKGIPDNIKAKIFDPFFTTKAVGKGTGLGLSLSYKTIRDHRGTLDFESTVGQGTKFRINLPLKANSD